MGPGSAVRHSATLGLIVVLALLRVETAAAQIVASGKTLTVTTANAVGTFNGPDLVGLTNALTNEQYLKKPSNGDLVQVDRITSTGQALQTSNWTVGAEPGTGLPLAAITAQDSARTFTLTVKIDPATQEIVLRSSAGVTSGGVRGASWSIAGLDLTAGKWIVPANSGSVFDAANPGVGAFIAYPNSWQAQMAVYQGAAGSLLLYSTDTQIYFKDLQQTTRGNSTLDVAIYTEATAPWPSATTVPAVEWRLKAFAGDWRAAAQPFRDWMVAAHPPLSNAAHPWVSNIRTVVEIGYQDTSLLAQLAAKVNPSQTLLYIPDWRLSAYDVNYPDYTPAAGVAAFVSAAHALGFKVMLHTDIVGVTPTNNDYAGVQPYQAKTPETLQPLGQFWDQPSNPLRYGLIDPAASAFRSLWISRVSAAVNAVNPDALHLDFTAMYNDGNGPIEGRTYTQGEELFNQQIVAAFPNLAIGCEEEFDFTYRYHSFAQADLFAFSAPGHPISPFLFSPQVYYYSNLNAPPPSDPSFKSHLLDMQRRTILPMWWVAGSSDLDTANVDNARFIGIVQSFQSHAFQPAWTADWTGALVRYQGLAGATAALTDDGRVAALSTATPPSTLFQLAHDANRLTTGTFINRWPAFDNATLYGLNPATMYFLDQVARPDATHATSLPQGIQLGSGTLVTPTFAHLEFAPPISFDFTNLSQALPGVRYQGVDYPLGFGAFVGLQTHTVGGESRAGLFIHPPWQGQAGGETFAEYSVPVPSGAALRFSVGIDDAASCTDGVTFRVTASGSEIWHQNVTRGAWHDVVLSLAAYGGTTVPLRLISNPGPASDASCDWGSWTKVAVGSSTPAIDVPIQLASGSIFSGIDGASYTTTSPTTGTVTNVPVPGGFTIFTQTGTAVTSGTGLTTLPFDVWSADQSGGLLKAGSVFSAGTVQSETSGGVTKNPAIWAHPPYGGRTVLSWALRLPASPLKLGWSAGIIDNAYSDDGVTFEVRVNGLPYWSLLTGVHGANHWTSGQLDLTRWQGQSILLELVSNSGANNNADWAAWGDLALSGSAASCSYGIPSSASIAAIGGSSTANITATATCPWSAVSNVPWLIVVSGSGSGNGAVTYDVAPNLGAARSGTLTVGGQTLTVTQGRSPTAPLNLSTDLVALGIAASNMVPNQPGLDAGPLFVAGVNYAKANGTTTVVADPGAYDFLSLTEINAHFALRNIDNMTIDLHGADLIFTHPLYYGMIVYYSTNAVVQNFTTDYQPLPFTQVRVASVDTANARILYTVEPGWSDPSAFNPLSGPAGAPDPTVDVQVFRGGRRVLGRLFTQRPFNGTAIPIVGTDPGTTLAGVRPGDVAVIALRHFATAISTNHCNGCTLRNVTVYSAPSAGVQALDTQNSVLERVYSIPKPGTDRQVSTFGIAMFPVIGPNNQIRLSRAIRTMDDGLAMVGLFVGTVQSQSSPRVLAVDGSGGPSILGDTDTIPNGSPVTFQRYSDGVVIASAIIVSQTTPAPAYPHQATFTFDRDLPSGVVGAAIYMTDANQNAANSAVERSLIQEPQGRLYIGGLANSIARGNYIRRTALSGVFMYQSTAPGDTLTAPLTNMTVSNNVIDGTNMASNWWWFQFASIQSVTLSTAYDLMAGSLFSNLNITNNFVADSGRSGVWLGNTNGGSVTGNYLLDPNARPDLPNAYGPRVADATKPLVIDTTSSGVTTSNNVVDTTSGRLHVTDTQYRELAAYAPGATMRLNAYNMGAFVTPSVTLTDADGVVTPIAIQSTTAHALDVQIPSTAALGGAYVTLMSNGAKYFGTLFVDSQDNIPAVNGCTYELSLSSRSVPKSASSLSILVVTQAGCAYPVLATDAFVTPGGTTTGTAVISVGFSANTGVTRSATIEIAGQPFTITQAGTLPDVVTSAATSIGPFGATVNGAVNPNGSSTTAVFQYGVTTSYGSQAAASPAPGSGTAPVAVSAVVGGLICNTAYHFRAVATNSGGTTNGADLTFTTAGCPSLTTLNLSQDLMRFGIASTNMVPNQGGLDAGPLLYQGVEYAKQHGIPLVIANPGAYYFLSLQNPNWHVQLQGISNITIDLQGSDLIFTHPLAEALYLGYNTNAVFQNFTVDYQPLPFTQVSVVSVNPATAQIQYAVQPGWQDPSTFNAAPAGTIIEVHIFRNGQPAFGTRRMAAQASISGNLITMIPYADIVPTPQNMSMIRPGDVAIVAMRTNIVTIVADRCVGCIFRNISVYSGTNAAIQTYFSSSSTLERIYMMPKPGTDRLVSAFGINSETPGPNSRIRLSRAIRSMDDGFGLFSHVTGLVQSQVSTRTLSVAGIPNTTLDWIVSVPDGSPVVFERPLDGAIVGSASVVSQTAGSTSIQPYVVTYTFDRDLPAGLVGSYMYTADANLRSANSAIERNMVQSSAGCCTGIDVGGWASNSAVHGNYIRRSAFAAIMGNQHLEQNCCDDKSEPLANVAFSNNVIDGANRSPAKNLPFYALGAIQISTLRTDQNGVDNLMTASPHQNITIANNFIVDAGRSAVWVGNTAGGTVNGNYFLNPNDQPDLPDVHPTYIADATIPLAIDTTSTGVTTSNNVVDTTSGRLHVTDALFRELAAYAPGGTIRLNAYNLGGLPNSVVTLTDADGTAAPLTIQSTTAHAVNVQLPASAALGGAYVTLTSGSAKYFGTLFIDSQDNIPAVNGCTYEISPSSTSVGGGASNLPILVVTQAGCAYEVLATDAFVNPGAGSSGTAVISVGFAANPGAARGATIEIAGQPIALTQSSSTFPVVVTAPATSIGASGATVNGTVNPNGSSTTALFQYGLTTSYGNQVAASPAPGSGTAPVAVSGVIGGLSCNTPYHVRAVATNASGTTNGADLTFTTGTCASAGGSISGVVTAAGTGSPLASVEVRLYTAAGVLVKTTLSGVTGAYTLDSLAAGTYYARTAVPGSLASYRDELYDSIPCVGCAVTGGTPIAVTNGATTGGINFALLPAYPFVVRADFNGDGKSDILWRHSSGAVTVWLMNGTRIIGADAVAVIDPSWQIVGLGDYNGDGKSDILWRHSSGAVTVWLMNGTRIIGSDAVSVIDASWQIVGSGDYNGDGKSDILWRHTSGAVTVWLMNGTRIIGADAVAVIDPSWQVVGSGDYNGDGKADILWRHTSGAVTVWLMNGTRIIGADAVAVIDKTWQILGSGDYNGDGKADILWRHTSGTVTIWLMNGTQKIGADAISAIDPSWQIVGSGDYNGDGTADLLWRHTSGAVTVWLLNGTRIIGSDAVAVIDPSWQTVFTR